MPNPYEGMKVYGPYFKPDARKIVSIIGNGKQFSRNYARYLLECKIGRLLTDNETCHHIDGNYLNDSLDNLEVKDKTEHRREHGIQSRSHFDKEFICAICGKTFTLTRIQCRSRASNINKRKFRGPLCSAICRRKTRGLIKSE